jgi:hypothetical protein
VCGGILWSRSGSSLPRSRGLRRSSLRSGRCCVAVPEPSHARCVPQEDYSRLMQMMNLARQANADLAKELSALQREKGASEETP